MRVLCIYCLIHILFQLSGKLEIAELFAIQLAAAPSTTVPGGARLIADKSLVRIEPHGVLRFAENSTRPVASEMFGKVLP